MNVPVIIGTDVLNRDCVKYVRTKGRQSLTRVDSSSHKVMTIQSEPFPVIHVSLVLSYKS